MIYHLAGATIQVAILVNYNCYPQEHDNTCPNIGFRNTVRRFINIRELEIEIREI